VAAADKAAASGRVDSSRAEGEHVVIVGDEGSVMARVGRAIAFLRENLRSAARGSAERGRIYDRTPSTILGGPAAGQFRDATAWRQVVPWAPIGDASREYYEWKLSHRLTREQIREHVRVEVRSDHGGEMRVLASPHVIRADGRADRP
jgi:hypothetical protein